MEVSDRTLIPVTLHLCMNLRMAEARDGSVVRQIEVGIRAGDLISMNTATHSFLTPATSAAHVSGQRLCPCRPNANGWDAMGQGPWAYHTVPRSDRVRGLTRAEKTTMDPLAARTVLIYDVARPGIISDTPGPSDCTTSPCCISTPAGEEGNPVIFLS